MMKRNLYIIGAGNVGGHIAQNFASYTDEYELRGFFDDDIDKIGTNKFGYDVLGPVSDMLKVRDAALIIGVAFPRVKKTIANKLSSNDSLIYPSFIHQRAWVSQDVEIGKGCIVYPGTSINHGSIIRDFVVINMNCALGHHNYVENYSSFAPGIQTGGHTMIEEGVDMGIGASTIQNIRVGSNSIVGGKSMLISDVPPYTTVAGVPAKVIGYDRVRRQAKVAENGS